MNCSPQELVKTARCFACVPKQQRWGAAAYLLCQWKNNQDVEPPPGPPFSWEPANAVITWLDALHLGGTSGDLAAFNATADLATVTDLDMRPSGITVTAVHNLSSLPAIRNLDLRGANLTTFDAGECDTLILLQIDGNLNLTSIDVTNCSHLDILSGNTLFSLATLILTGCSLLTILTITNALNPLVINFADIPNLRNFDGNTTGIFGANFSVCPLINQINISTCSNIFAVNVTGCAALTQLIAQSISITTLDVSTCTSMNYLDLNSCGLSDVDITNVICAIAAHAVNNGFMDVANMVPPTAPGLVCSNALDPARGWTVFHD